MIIVQDQMPYCSCPSQQCLKILPGIDTIDLRPAKMIYRSGLFLPGAFKDVSDICVVALRNVFFGSIVGFFNQFRA
jgi:hypothetical protein